MNFFRRKKYLRVTLWSHCDEGKTFLLYKGFKNVRDFKSIPTIGFNVESIEYNGVTITYWDIGGACKIKELRKHYLQDSDAVIFLIDSSSKIEPYDTYSSHSSFYENFIELQKCIEVMEDKPVLIAITKIDKRVETTKDIINAYQLDRFFNRKKKFGIIECTSNTSEGIKEIKFWLSDLAKSI